MKTKSTPPISRVEHRVPPIGLSRITRSLPRVNSTATSAAGHRISSFGFSFAVGRGLLLAFFTCACLTGCSLLKPVKTTTHYYVLTAMPASDPVKVAPGTLAVGVGQVKIPAYLFNRSLTVRKGTNEIEYLESTLWAESLDAGFQRVLAANLANDLPTDQIRLTAWQKADVAAEVYVAIAQFDVDTSGQGVLVARWRILSPGGEKTFKSGESRFVRKGSPPDAGASQAVATLSELAADLSRQLAQALKELPPAPDGAIKP